MTAPFSPLTRPRTSFGMKRFYEDLDAQGLQRPRERPAPFTPAPYMQSVSSPALALEEAARARRRVADCAMEPLLREIHLQSHRWWLAHVKTIRERMAQSRERHRSQTRMLERANALPAATERAVDAMREAV